MARLGLYPALIIVMFGVVAPFFIFRFGRLVGFAPLLVLAFVLGLGYGAVKAEYPWVAERSARKCRLHGGQRLPPRHLRRRQLQRGRPDRQNDQVFRIGAKVRWRSVDDDSA